MFGASWADCARGQRRGSRLGTAVEQLRVAVVLTLVHRGAGTRARRRPRRDRPSHSRTRHPSSISADRCGSGAARADRRFDERTTSGLGPPKREPQKSRSKVDVGMPWTARVRITTMTDKRRGLLVETDPAARELTSVPSPIVPPSPYRSGRATSALPLAAFSHRSCCPRLAPEARSRPTQRYRGVVHRGLR